jgi:hypothetical protein
MLLANRESTLLLASRAAEVGKSAVRKGDITIAFKAIALSDLPTGHKRVATALLDHFNRATGRCDPSMETLSLLLQISRRSVVRAINRLIRERYFERDRHAGNFHCNQYYPVWETFREIDADWVRRRDMHRSRFDRTKLSLPPCQTSHLDGDTGVTQTCPNNHSYETFSGGLPSEGNDRAAKKPIEVALSTMGSISKRVQLPAETFHVRQVKSSEAARDSAERRWNAALLGRYAQQADLYARIIEAIDRPLSESATNEELRFRGAGIKHILGELRCRDLAPGDLPGDRE